MPACRTVQLFTLTGEASKVSEIFEVGSAQKAMRAPMGIDRDN